MFCKTQRLKCGKPSHDALPRSFRADAAEQPPIIVEQTQYGGGGSLYSRSLSGRLASCSLSASSLSLLVPSSPQRVLRLLAIGEEVLRETSEEQARAEKEWEDIIKKEEAERELFILEFGVYTDSEYETD
ncbi:hypothetical protein Tco_1570934 [Tanacetum coccineum]